MDASVAVKGKGPHATKSLKTPQTKECSCAVKGKSAKPKPVTSSVTAPATNVKVALAPELLRDMATYFVGWGKHYLSKSTDPRMLTINKIITGYLKLLNLNTETLKAQLASIFSNKDIAKNNDTFKIFSIFSKTPQLSKAIEKNYGKLHKVLLKFEGALFEATKFIKTYAKWYNPKAGGIVMVKWVIKSIDSHLERLEEHADALKGLASGRTKGAANQLLATLFEAAANNEALSAKIKGQYPKLAKLLDGYMK